jgi:hypothetical protein
MKTMNETDDGLVFEGAFYERDDIRWPDGIDPATVRPCGCSVNSEAGCDDCNFNPFED